MKEIIDQLMEYDELYFVEGKSPISDTEYDLLRSKAQQQFPNHPYFSKVGFESKFEEIDLPFIIGGLEKVDVETTSSWLEKKNDDIVASEKLDGNTVTCIWEDGKLVFAASRGNGYKGQNLLKKGKYFIPELKVKGRIALRGEILLRGNSFKDLGFKNRRNAVAGLLRRDFVEPEILKNLFVIWYEVLEAPEVFNLQTEILRLAFINILKLQPVRHIFISKEMNHNQVVSLLEDTLKFFKETSDYDIDGLVLTRYNSIRENTLHPAHKVKFKVNESAIKCKVVGLEWNVTRIGYIKPVILIEPVDILGVTVSRVSGFNKEFIYNSGIGKGSVIGVVRSGDVIPYVTEVFDRVEIEKLTTCPNCGGQLKETDKDYLCTNDTCFYKNILEVSHFFTTLGVDGFSEKTIQNIGKTTIKEIYELTKEELEKIPGFGEKKAENIINEIKKTLTTKPDLLLAAFGIPLVGRTASKQICNKFAFDELFDITDSIDVGVGLKISENLVGNIQNYKDLYLYLKSIGLEFEEVNEDLKTLKGMKFALTGEGPMKRSEIQKLIEAKGGEVGSVGKSTTFLVTNDPDSNSGKSNQARKLGVNVINYELLFNSYLKG
jgi:DNA ligase (NAD+)